MKKEYLRPEVEVISLMPKENIASSEQFEDVEGNLIDGTLALESSIF